ncbi:hypothetical protein LG200_00905 [Methylobacillus caricis]|uniref:hypothetical protein n=1 Tax=Methylobacillus caricis TaxID=1971611 RepID=UPI001CFF9050|nr:hypothetical protein [Methylobacillus caricis]MCB5186560.1 hypothetical protein [Methylobacillus caricis]
MKHPLIVNGLKEPTWFAKSKVISVDFGGEQGPEEARKALQKKMHVLTFQNKKQAAMRAQINSEKVYKNLDNGDLEHK